MGKFFEARADVIDISGRESEIQGRLRFSWLILVGLAMDATESGAPDWFAKGGILDPGDRPVSRFDG